MTTTAKQVQQYVNCVFEPGDVVEVRAIHPDGRVKKFWRLACELLKLVPELLRLNRQGYNVYAGVNPRRGDGLSGDENVALCRCLFADFDGVEPGDGCGVWEFCEARIYEAGLPQPTLAVFSGHGAHPYWRFAEPLLPSHWIGLQERLIVALGSDRVVKNRERIMRLPGFDNCKYDPHVPCFVMFVNEDTF